MKTQEPTPTTTKADARCCECDTVFVVGPIAKCPHCNSRYLEPVELPKGAR